MLKKYNSVKYIIKITGRYYIENIGSFLLPLLYSKPESKCIRQQNPERCEIVGCNIKHVDDIFHFPGHHWHIETVYKHRIEKYNLNEILTLSKIPIAATVQGGTGIVFTNL